MTDATPQRLDATPDATHRDGNAWLAQAVADVSPKPSDNPPADQPPAMIVTRKHARTTLP